MCWDEASSPARKVIESFFNVLLQYTTLLALFEVKIAALAQMDPSFFTFDLRAATRDLLDHYAYLIEAEAGAAGTTKIDPYSLELFSEIGRTDRTESDALVYVYRGTTLVLTMAIDFKCEKVHHELAKGHATRTDPMILPR
ncbi:BZ3500_MvSof-1268-A1-R1_Chr6-3g08931 [Microbotryum saponariae]|uniref:BZ3500_MvSof-1268-A1-R1_Chr6-3g08931 protein n=1 Tax=Microbotryum saponariae TaxID=289078 RepID=A0A2X0LD79_9BASI|nr:BZ3500_MvSof-1268-A1-R1_Chr6-3g08931 [Microbotryum saponariae]SDA07533.1 BZ3501_MvSof-1269-A2-R1_Chr6-2g08635 [Microbotryum saponariae]